MELAAELRRRLGGSYKTAWFAAHRIRAAMRGRGEEILRSVVEAELGQPSRSALAPHGRFEERAASGAPGPGLRHDDLVAQLGRLIAASPPERENRVAEGVRVAAMRHAPAVLVEVGEQVLRAQVVVRPGDETTELGHQVVVAELGARSS